MKASTHSLVGTTNGSPGTAWMSDARSSSSTIKRAEEAGSETAEIRKRRERELSGPLGYCVPARGMD